MTPALKDPKSSPNKDLGREGGDRAVVMKSAELFAGRNEVIIVHNGREYRLRCTRLGKLILTA